jgi:hypothetical protein
MRTLAFAAVLAMAAGATTADTLPRSNAALVQGSQTCLRVDRILGRTILDNQTIVFRMNDGTFWKNTLQRPCVGLAVRDGFSFATLDNFICSNKQRIRVLGQGNICFLGDFAQTGSPVKTTTAQ